MNSIRNTATGLLVVAYGDLKERATIDCAYLNKTELRYGRPAIFEVTTETTSQPRPPAPVVEESAGPQWPASFIARSTASPGNRNDVTRSMFSMN
jgi:hypothetical protein